MLRLLLQSKVCAHVVYPSKSAGMHKTINLSRWASTGYKTKWHCCSQTLAIVAAVVAVPLLAISLLGEPLLAVEDVRSMEGVFSIW